MTSTALTTKNPFFARVESISSAFDTYHSQ
jgi:hypothetical protein